MSLLLFLLLTLCIILFTSLYIRFRNSVPKSNRKVWNRKDTSSLENTLQKIIGKNMTSYIVDTSSQRKNSWSPYIPPSHKFNSNPSGVVLEYDSRVNQQQETTNNNETIGYPNNNNNNFSTLDIQQNNQQTLNISTIPIASQSTLLSIQPNTLNSENVLTNIIYRKPTIDRLDKKPIYTSPHSSKKFSTPNSSASKKKVIYFDNSKFLEGVGVSPILPDKKIREEAIYVPNSSFINQSIVLEPFTEMETKPQQTIQAVNTSEGETTGMLADASMISVGDNKKSPKGILRKRDPLGNFANQSMNLSAQLNESDILNSSILKKKKVDFDQAVKNQNLKRTRPVGFERTAPPPSETSFSREAQKRTKTSDTVMSNSNAPTPSFESPKPKPVQILPATPPSNNVIDDSLMMDNSMIRESVVDKNDSIILDFKPSESKPKRKLGGRVGFSTPSTFRNQKILRYSEDIVQRKELAFHLLKGEPSPEKKLTTQNTNKADDSNLGSSFNLSSLAKRSTDTISEEPPKPSSETTTTAVGFTFTAGSVSNNTASENKKTEDKANPTFILPTNASKRDSIQKQSSQTATTDTSPQGLDLSAFKQPEPKSVNITQPSVKPVLIEKATTDIPAKPQENSSKDDINPFASITISSSASKPPSNQPSSSKDDINPFANLKVATPTEQKKSVFNPFANATSSNVFGTPSASRNAFTKTTSSKPADTVSDFAKMDPSIFQREALSFGSQK